MKYYILITATVLLASCSSNSNNKAGSKFPDQVRTNFIKGCAAKLPAGYEKKCECMLEQIEKKYTLEQYAQIESDIKAGKDVATFIAYTDSARNTCFPEVKK